MNYIKKSLYMITLMLLTIVPTVSLGAAQLDQSNQAISSYIANGQGLGEGININNQQTGFFKDAIYPLEGDFAAATYNGHQQPGALDLTKGNDTYNQPIYAVKDGTVEIAKGGCTGGHLGDSCNGGYGNHVEINHGNGYQTLYAHMIPGSIQVEQGQEVKQGDVIGYVGSTGNSSGPHLHFEVRQNEVSQPVEDYFAIPNISYNNL